jgi:glycerate 2-kinase
MASNSVGGRHAQAIFQAALEAADPGRCILDSVQLKSDTLSIQDLDFSFRDVSKIVVIGAGKATPAMAVAIESILGNRIAGGSINTKYHHRQPLEYIQTTECGHPLPDQAGVDGTERILNLIDHLDPDALIIALFSGGGSALLPAPVSPITLAEKQLTTQLLLECGATIGQTNTIRKHLSEIKGGLLARRAYPAQVVSLLISDVIGDHLDTIASGPAYPDATTYADCIDLVEHFDLKSKLPTSVYQRLTGGMKGSIPDTPDATEACFNRTHSRIIGNNTLAIEAATKKAWQLGYQPLVLSSRIAGETQDVAHVHTAVAQQVRISGQPIAAPACIISGGETTVTLRGNGKGGRNQEFALAAALDLDDWKDITILSAGTDGTDGPTDAAGAIVDGQTVSRAKAQNIDPADFLLRNDSYSFFKALDDLLITGPTGTNVMDLRLLLIQ